MRTDPSTNGDHLAAVERTPDVNRETPASNAVPEHRGRRAAEAVVASVRPFHASRAIQCAIAAYRGSWDRPDNKFADAVLTPVAKERRGQLRHGG
jgi:hypothetical protein